jgi:hypothetical protein
MIPYPRTSKGADMRGADLRNEALFSYVNLEDRVPASHPLRKIREIVNAALAALDAALIAPGGGLSPDGTRWVPCRRRFFLPVRVLSKLFRRLMLEKLAAAHKAGKLRFFGEHAHLASADAFAAFLVPLRKTKWFVYSKRPFAGPEAAISTPLK